MTFALSSLYRECYCTPW